MRISKDEIKALRFIGKNKRDVNEISSIVFIENNCFYICNNCMILKLQSSKYDKSSLPNKLITNNDFKGLIWFDLLNNQYKNMPFREPFDILNYVYFSQDDKSITLTSTDLEVTSITKSRLLEENRHPLPANVKDHINTSEKKIMIEPNFTPDFIKDLKSKKSVYEAIFLYINKETKDITISDKSNEVIDNNIIKIVLDKYYFKGCLEFLNLSNNSNIKIFLGDNEGKINTNNQGYCRDSLVMVSNDKRYSLELLPVNFRIGDYEEGDF